MIGKSFVVICAIVGIAAGNCCLPQCGSVLSTGYIGGPSCGAVGVFPLVAGSNGMGVGAIATDGPETAPLPIVQAPPVTLPTIEGPVVALPSQPIPAPRVIAQRCICTKTVVKPQVIQRHITVPKVQRYLKRTVTPVVENITYKSRPISPCRNSCYSARAC